MLRTILVYPMIIFTAVLFGAIAGEVSLIFVGLANHLPNAIVDISGSVASASVAPQEGWRPFRLVIPKNNAAKSRVDSIFTLQLGAILIGSIIYVSYMGAQARIRGLRTPRYSVTDFINVVVDLIFITMPFALSIVLGVLIMLTQNNYSEAVEVSTVGLTIWIPMVMCMQATVKMLTLRNRPGYVSIIPWK